MEHLYQHRNDRKTTKPLECKAIAQTTIRRAALSYQSLSQMFRPIRLRFSTFIWNFIFHFFAIIILQGMNTPIRSTIRTDVAVMLNVFNVDQKIASWTPIVFDVPTSQDENVKRDARNRDNCIHYERYQIKRGEHVVNTFFNNSLLESRLMSLIEARQHSTVAGYLQVRLIVRVFLCRPLFLLF
jgi:hypothetical protein